MLPSNKPEYKVDQILAADHNSGNVDPANDQIWRLTTGEGEPPALALASSFGLRAYNMRIFPRFHHDHVPVTDPTSFSKYPVVQFSAPNFIQLDFSPISFLDVTLRIWVPTSQVVVGQVNLNISTNQPESVTMEWVALLSPFSGGTPMTAIVQGINTILTGHIREIDPVFLLTGTPRTDLSTYPGLGLDLSMRPGVPRQVTWVMASLENKDLSFYTARRYSAVSLEAEQFKIEIAQKKKSLHLETEDSVFNNRVRQSQNRAEQLLMPAFGKFQNGTFVQGRCPDNGYSLSRDASDSGPNWGIQTSLDTWLLSRIFLPTHVEVLEGILDNFLAQQTADGAIDLLTSWTGRRTGKLATPILASLTADLYPYIKRKDWLARVYPALLRGVKAWFTGKTDRDEDGFPEWQHELQLGYPTSTGTDDEKSVNRSILVRTAESPALAALLYRECKSLMEMAVLLSRDEDLTWLKEKADLLADLVNSCWKETCNSFLDRDALNHRCDAPVKPITFHRNGLFPIAAKKSTTSFTVINVKILGDFPHPISLELHLLKEMIALTEKDFEWHGGNGIVVLDHSLDSIREFRISGLKKGEAFLLMEPDFTRFEATQIIPFWAGLATREQTATFCQKHLAEIEILAKSNDLFPTYLKVMLIEALIRGDLLEQATHLFRTWYIGETIDNENETKSDAKIPTNNDFNKLDELIPLHTYLTLNGISSWTPEEIIMENVNPLLAPITVQYGQTTIELDRNMRSVKHENGENYPIIQAGKIKIVTA